jgi:hypothetical protein
VLQVPASEALSIILPLLPSAYPGRLASRNSTAWDDLLCPFYNPSAWTTQKTQPLYSWESVFTALLHSNGSYSIVACVFVAAVMLLTEYLPTSGRLFWFYYSDYRASCHNMFVCSLWGPRQRTLAFTAGTGGSIPGCKAAWAWSWPHTSISNVELKNDGAILTLPHTSSWRGVCVRVLAHVFCFKKNRENALTVCRKNEGTKSIAVLDCVLQIFLTQSHVSLCLPCALHCDEGTGLWEKAKQ